MAETSQKNLAIVRDFLKFLEIILSLSILALPVRSWLYIRKQQNAKDDEAVDDLTKRAGKTLEDYKEKFLKNPRLWKLQEKTADNSGPILMLALCCLLATALFLADSSLTWMMEHSKSYAKYLIEVSFKIR